MATFTENYDLIKPGEADYYDIADWNENMDTIDETMAATAGEINTMSEKMGSPADDAGADTLFGRIAGLAEKSGEGSSVIKKIQRRTCNLKETESTTIAIEPVNPAKCFVISERLCDENNVPAKCYGYSLGAEAITATAEKPTWDLIIGFWIIEFI